MYRRYCKRLPLRYSYRSSSRPCSRRQSQFDCFVSHRWGRRKLWMLVSWIARIESGSMGDVLTLQLGPTSLSALL